MTSAPLVSVIIPVWNGAHFLPDALASIRAQNYTPIEILVADDGSTDDTAEVAARQGDVCYLAFPHRGSACTRLAGIEAARGEIVAFLDVDDLWSETKLERQLKLLQENPRVMIVNGYTQLMRVVGQDKSIGRFENWGEPVLAPSFGSALFRRAVFEPLKLADDLHTSPNDLPWFMRAREQQIPMLIHVDVVQYYRRHEKNISNDHAGGKRALLGMLRDSLARRSVLGQEGRELAPLDFQVQDRSG